MKRFNSPVWTAITATAAVLSAMVLAAAADDGGESALLRMFSGDAFGLPMLAAD